MSAKDKAKELFNKMYHVDDPMGNYPMCFDTAKQCALIAVDEMLDFRNALYINEGSLAHQWLLDVKQEIELL
jgi:hypothetical protein